MRPGRIEVKRRVWAGLGGAVLVTLAWWGWTWRQPPSVTAPGASRPPFVRLVGPGTAVNEQLLRERADLFDPTPLFFPTEWNYGQRPLPEALRRQPGQVFESIPPLLTVKEQNLKVYGAETVPPPESLADVLTQGNEAPFAGMGQVDGPRAPLPERDSFLEIRSFGRSETVIAQTLKDISLPRLDYAPVEFIIAVGAAGVIGEPVMVSGSGWEEVDAFFRFYLIKTFRVGERLTPGRYRVVVGP